VVALVTALQIPIAYAPNPKQREFHSLSAKYRGFCGGWGNGKTSGGCAEFFMRLMEFPGTNSIIARKTRPELRTTTWSMLVDGDTQPTGWRGIPKEVIEIYNKSDLYIKLRNGSQIHGLPLDDPKKLENYNLGLFMLDQAEEVEEEIMLKVFGRLRQHDAPREGMFLFNPNGHNWLWRRFIDPQRKDAWKNMYRCVEATPFDNPNLPADYLEQFEGLPKHWYDRFVLGSHEVFVGQIFTDFNPEVHVIDPFYIPRDWERWCSIDPGIGHEGAVNWIARDYENNCYLYREIVEAGQPISWWADEIAEAEAEPDIGGPDEEITVRMIGMESQQRSQQDGRTVKGVYEEEGVDDLELADRDPIARINRITSRLRPTPNHRHPRGLDDTDCYDQEGNVVGRGSPSFYIFENCTYTVEHLPQYRWRPQRTNFTEESPAEKPRKKDDHTVDNIGHIFVSIGDSEPDVPENSRPVDPESRFADEHFEKEMALAEERSPVRARGHRKLREAA
jgi:phage terminase large subunit